MYMYILMAWLNIHTIMYIHTYVVFVHMKMCMVQLSMVLGDSLGLFEKSSNTSPVPSVYLLAL